MEIRDVMRKWADGLLEGEFVTQSSLDILEDRIRRHYADDKAAANCRQGVPGQCQGGPEQRAD